MNCTRRVLLVVAIAAGLSGVTELAAFAQKDATSKSRGEHSVPFWSSRSSHRRLQHARDYARDFHGYIVANPKPDPLVAKEVTNEIGKNLEEVKKHLAAMKKDFAEEKEAVAGIESLEKQLTVAFDEHKRLGACCVKANFDAIETMECCSNLASQLDKIIAAHEELMRKLVRKPAAPAGTR